MQGKITKRSVDGLAVPADGEAVLWDTEIKGFGLRVRSGGARTYVLHYRMGGGRKAALRKVTIGKHGSPWTPDTARSEAKRLLGLVEAGTDPASDRMADRSQPTFAELIDLYVAEGCSHKKPTTLKADHGRFEHHLRPLLGRLKANKIERADIERMRDAVASGKTAEKPAEDGGRRPGSMAKGGKGAAAQCVALTGAVLAFAVARGLRKDNPAAGIKKAPVRKIERFLSEVEIARLATVLEAEKEASGNPFPVAGIKLLLLTGCRRSEIVGLCWQHVDFEHRCLRLPDSKTGAKIVYLNPPALALLAELPRVKDNPHVIAGNRKGASLVGLDKVWFRVRKAAELPDVRLHDLRHSFASVGAIGGFSLPIIGALLGHKHTATTARYAHLSADPLRAANEAVGSHIEAAMQRGRDAGKGAEIIALPVRRRKVKHKLMAGSGGA
jgi:integrase